MRCCNTSGQPGPSSAPAGLGGVVNDGGVATIYATQQPRTREQIDTDMSDVGLPSYALDLLGGFDNIQGEISLSSSSPNGRGPVSFPSQLSTPSSSRARSAFSAIRRPLSFMGHKPSDSVATAGPGSSVRMSGDGVVLAERPSTPVGSMNSMEKHRWGGPSSSPAKALTKMKNRLSMMGGKR